MKYLSPRRPHPALRLAPWLILAVLLLLPQIAHADDGTVFEEYKSKGLAWAYLGAFGFGLLTSLTPCVYPMIPIVVGIFGGRGASVSRGRALLLATLYVVGMGLMFAGLGVVFAMIGKRSGSLLGDPVVVIPIVLLYLILAASMFGAFELQLPMALQQKLSSVSGDGAAGAFGMGLVGGFTAAPCTGPFLLGILGYVAQTKDVVVGSTLLFTYALGMGVLFWVLAAFAVALPKSGRWMEWMKSLGGIALVIAGIHFLKPIAPSIERIVATPGWFLAAALALAAGGLALGAIHLSFHDAWGVRLRKGAAVAMTVIGFSLAINWMLAVDRHLAWVRGDEAAAFAKAKAEGKGVMIDFWASWCTPCKEFEHTFAASPVFETINANFVPLQIDMTAESDATSAIQERYSAGTPTVIFLTADGKELGRFHEYVTPGPFMKVLGPAADAVKAGQTAALEPPPATGATAATP
ncbi:MAG: thioredoxin family protein [Myxococcales bacterium]|nr:thioredoxin family protein [Myxococcales bacterium]